MRIGEPLPEFQSTLPARGATLQVEIFTVFIIISIHAPRTGSDGWKVPQIAAMLDFNPRSPHGERHSTHYKY